MNIISTVQHSTSFWILVALTGLKGIQAISGSVKGRGSDGGEKTETVNIRGMSDLRNKEEIKKELLKKVGNKGEKW